MRVPGRRLELLVAQKNLDHAHVGLLFQQVSGEAVTKRMQASPRLVDVGGFSGLMEQPVELTTGQVIQAVASEEPATGLDDLLRMGVAVPLA